MKQLAELIGGLVILFGGLSTLGLMGTQGLQTTQAVQVGVVGSLKKEVEVEEARQVNLQTTLNATGKAIEEAKTPEEYYKEDWEMWERMKAYYKDYYAVRGGIDEQHN